MDIKNKLCTKQICGAFTLDEENRPVANQAIFAFIFTHRHKAGKQNHDENPIRIIVNA